MAINPRADLSAMMADLGVVVIRGNVTVRGLLDEEQAIRLDGSGQEVRILQTAVTIPTTAFPDLAVDEVLTIDGAAYTVRDVGVIEDGNLTRVVVART